MNYWIKERNNPQLGTYFVACGQMSAKDAWKHEKPLYGVNTMHSFTSRRAYETRLLELGLAIPARQRTAISA